MGMLEGEWAAFNIHCNCVAFGGIDTRMATKAIARQHGHEVRLDPELREMNQHIL